VRVRASGESQQCADVWSCWQYSRALLPDQYYPSNSGALRHEDTRKVADHSEDRRK
jgi:hypothetical protein